MRLESWHRSRTIVQWRVGVVLNRSVQRLAGSDWRRLLNNWVLKLGLLEDWLIGCTRIGSEGLVRLGTAWLTAGPRTNGLWTSEAVEVKGRDVLRLLRLVVREGVVKVNGPSGLLTNWLTDGAWP